MMKKCCPYVVQVAKQCEQAFTLLVVPDLYFVIVTAWHEQRLLAVKRYATHGSLVLVELVDHCRHTIIPQLYDARV